MLSMCLSSSRRAAPSSGENGDELIGKRKKNVTAGLSDCSAHEDRTFFAKEMHRVGTL